MIVEIESEKLVEFSSHPFKIVNDEKMQELINSIVNSEKAFAYKMNLMKKHHH